MPEPPADHVDRHHAVDHRRRRTDRDQRIHVGRALEEGLEAHLVVFAVDVGDRKRQQQLGEREDERVCRPVQEMGQRQAHHMPHRDVEKRDQENEGDDQPPLHVGDLGRHRVGGGRRLRLRAGRSRARVHRGSVAGLLDRMDDGGVARGRLVVVDRHIVGEQVDRHRPDARDLRHALFHVRRAGGTGHARHIEFLLHGFHPFDTPRGWGWVCCYSIPILSTCQGVCALYIGNAMMYNKICLI